MIYQVLHSTVVQALNVPTPVSPVVWTTFHQCPQFHSQGPRISPLAGTNGIIKT